MLLADQHHRGPPVGQQGCGVCVCGARQHKGFQRLTALRPAGRHHGCRHTCRAGCRVRLVAQPGLDFRLCREGAAAGLQTWCAVNHRRCRKARGNRCAIRGGCICGQAGGRVGCWRYTGYGRDLYTKGGLCRYCGLGGWRRCLRCGTCTGRGRRRRWPGRQGHRCAGTQQHRGHHYQRFRGKTAVAGLVQRWHVHGVPANFA
ncbi:hypothetical protein D9M73_141270 [compost metagenome]